jgi:acyl-coenzyme A thioesterase PaaI-like protein
VVPPQAAARSTWSRKRASGWAPRNSSDSFSTAAAAAAEAAGPEAGHGDPREDLLPRYVWASLRVDYLRPTPLGPEIEVRGRAREATGRRVVVEARVLVNGQVTAQGTVVAVRMPEGMARS